MLAGLSAEAAVQVAEGLKRVLASPRGVLYLPVEGQGLVVVLAGAIDTAERLSRSPRDLRVLASPAAPFCSWRKG